MSTGYPDLDAKLGPLKAECIRMFGDPLNYSVHDVNRNYDAQRACYDEAESRNRRRTVLTFLILLALAVMLSWGLAKLFGSASPAPRTASISTQHVGVGVPSDGLGLPRPFYMGLQDGPRSTIVLSASSTLDATARWAALATHAAGWGPKNRAGPSGAAAAMGPPWLSDFSTHTTATPRSSPQEADHDGC